MTALLPLLPIDPLCDTTRRKLVFAVTGVPLVATALQKVWNIGVLMGGVRSPHNEQQAAAFRDSARKAATREGRELTFDVQWGGGDIQQIRAAADSMSKVAFDVYAVSTATATRELLRVVRGKPVVFWAVSDPVGNGFVSNAARPGGHVTGFTLYPYEIGGKWLQLLREASPSIRQAYVLMSADNPNIVGWRRSMDADAARMKLKLAWPEIHGTSELEAALAAAVRSPATGIVALADPFLSRPEHIALLAAHAMKAPMVTGVSVGAENGSLVSYEVDQIELARRAGGYVARIVHGEKAGELPVQGADAYRLVVNRRVQRALGMELPQSLLVRADLLVD